MIEFAGLLFGGIFRFLPELLKFFNAKEDRAHERNMIELNLKLDQARATQQIDLANAQANIAANKADMDALIEAIKAQNTPSGIAWIDGLSSSVRPVLTYWHCMILYTAGKAVSVAVAVQTNTKLADYLPILTTEFDRMIVASMFSFWFVDRSLRKAGKL